MIAKVLVTLALEEDKENLFIAMSPIDYNLMALDAEGLITEEPRTFLGIPVKLWFSKDPPMILRKVSS